MPEKLSHGQKKPIKTFSASAISAALKDDGLDVLLFDELDSTSTHARRLVANGKRAPFLVVANSQSAGRGRLGRTFYSPADSGLYMTLALDSVACDVSITTRTSVALCRAIESVFGIRDAKIKWVNDIYLNSRKVAGILAESVESPSGNRVVLIGAGVNICTESFPAELDGIAASLGGSTDMRAELCGALTNEIFSILGQGARECMDEYRKRSIVLGRGVNYFVNGEKRFGCVNAILDSGALEIITPDGKQEILNSGEISLRML